MIIAAAERALDGRGDLEAVARCLRLLDDRGLRTRELKIAPLRLPWNDALPQGYLRGATAPLEAISITASLFHSGQADAILVTGSDRLRSDYTADERKRLMRVFEGGQTHLQGYAHLTRRFLDSVGLSRADFVVIAERLFENYLRTWRAASPEAAMPDGRWFGFVNEYFRGVDCANPYTDFSGAMIVLTEEAAGHCGIAPQDQVRILACETCEAGTDTIADTAKVVAYEHLEEAFARCCRQSGIDFRARFLAGDALLEVYSCYPVVPLAFLLHTGLVRDLTEVSRFLNRFELTVTGGLNLARAPWNNTTLNSIVAMTHRLRGPGQKRLACIHSNASLGYRQGILLLEAGS